MSKDMLIKMALSKPVIKDVPALRVVSKRDKGSYGETIGRLIGELCEMLFWPVNQKKSQMACSLRSAA